MAINIKSLAISAVKDVAGSIDLKSAAKIPDVGSLMGGFSMPNVKGISNAVNLDTVKSAINDVKNLKEMNQLTDVNAITEKLTKYIPNMEGIPDINDLKNITNTTDPEKLMSQLGMGDIESQVRSQMESSNIDIPSESEIMAQVNSEINSKMSSMEGIESIPDISSYLNF